MKKGFPGAILTGLLVLLASCAPAVTSTQAPAILRQAQSIRVPHGLYSFSVTHSVRELTGDPDTFAQLHPEAEMTAMAGDQIALGNFTSRFKLSDGSKEDVLNIHLVKVEGNRKILSRTDERIVFADELTLTFETQNRGIGYSGDYILEVSFDSGFKRKLRLSILEALN
ncbi:hypothetical protein [Deinococcus roseus]|uniref:DUF4426 domain-containing protein n=1 Tax=Deinococcus roseus TaxID=392414 RepID=A0ABQ2CTN8_9DEIO|nr:hypothetical protein [Deinococcus roseus]GGJ19911.1 hypothetical protein GCM10008938_02620 [Deinococcus roseus]